MESVDAMLRKLFALSTDSRLLADTTLNPDRNDTKDANVSADSNENPDKMFRMLLHEAIEYRLRECLLWARKASPDVMAVDGTSTSTTTGWVTGLRTPGTKPIDDDIWCSIGLFFLKMTTFYNKNTKKFLSKLNLENKLNLYKIFSD